MKRMLPAMFSETRCGRIRRYLVLALGLMSFCIAESQERNEPIPWLGLAGVDFESSGEITQWRTNGLGASQEKILEAGTVLLGLTIRDMDRDISSEVTWRKISPAPNELAAFAGNHEGMGFEIRRSYLLGTVAGTLLHRIMVSGAPGQNSLRLEVALPNSLVRHSQQDGSLGDYFYGYRWVLGSENASSEFELASPGAAVSRIALVARHVALVVDSVSGENSVYSIDPENQAFYSISGADLASPDVRSISAVALRDSILKNSDLEGLMYAHSAAVIGFLARTIEAILELLDRTIGNVGLAVIVFALILRVLFLPLSLWSQREQRRFSAIQQAMKPKIAEISKAFKGAEKSERILQTYKDFGVSPMSGLKGSLGLFIQLPILIALFAVTTESALFRDAALLGISDLSLPDRTFALPLQVPGLGGDLNVLPILLGLVCIAAAVIPYMSTRAKSGSVPRSGLILALAFVIFFYNCAAALVIYWTIVNLSQIFEGIYLSRTLHASRDRVD